MDRNISLKYGEIHPQNAGNSVSESQLNPKICRSMPGIPLEMCRHSNLKLPPPNFVKAGSAPDNGLHKFPRMPFGLSSAPCKKNKIFMRWNFYRWMLKQPCECHANASCNNAIRSYMCAFDPGYSGDGYI